VTTVNSNQNKLYVQ